MASFEHSGEDMAEDELYKVRHSLAHVLAQAVLELRPGSTLGFGPPISDGFIASPPFEPPLEPGASTMVHEYCPYSNADASPVAAWLVVRIS